MTRPTPTELHARLWLSAAVFVAVVVVMTLCGHVDGTHAGKVAIQ